MRSSEFKISGTVNRLPGGDHWNLCNGPNSLLEFNDTRFTGIKKLGLKTGDQLEINLKVIHRAFPTL